MLTLVAIAGLAQASIAAGVRQRIYARVARIMDKAQYRHGRWGLLASGPRDGVPLQSSNPGEAFVPGSATQLYSISTAWNTLGPGHRFTRPCTPWADARRVNWTGTRQVRRSGIPRVNGNVVIGDRLFDPRTPC